MNAWIVRICKSKTMIVGTLISALGVIQSQTDFLSTVMEPKSFGWLMLGIGIAMKILRAITDQPLSDK